MVTSSISIVTFVMHVLPLLFFVSCPIYVAGPLPSDWDPFPSLLFPKWLPLMYGPKFLSSMYTEPLRYGLGRSSPIICCSLVELYDFCAPSFGTLFLILYIGVANFLVGLAFLPLRNTLSGGDPTKEGRVFYVFAGLLFLCSFVFFRSYRSRI